MITKERESQDHDSLNLAAQTSANFIPRNSLIKRLSRSKEARDKFAESNLNRSIAFQIKALRAREQWTQEQLAKHLGMRYQNNVSARLENSRYGKHSLSTLKKIAAAFDVALVVWFIPYSRFIDWATETPYIDKGLTEDFYNIPEFSKDSNLQHEKEEISAEKIAAKIAVEDALVLDLGRRVEQDVKGFKVEKEKPPEKKKAKSIKAEDMSFNVLSIKSEENRREA